MAYVPGILYNYVTAEGSVSVLKSEHKSCQYPYLFPLHGQDHCPCVFMMHTSA